MIKKLIKKILLKYGYQIVRTPYLQADPFIIQNQLIKACKPIIFDIGAHLGKITQVYRERFPDSLIYCFEPFPNSFDILSRNTAHDSRTFCLNQAIYSNKGTKVLNVNVSSATNSLLTTDQRASIFWGEQLLDTTSYIEVPTTTIDLFCNENNIFCIDILKMDVQGGEFSVLLGAKDMLANQNISLIYSELITCPTYVGQHKLHEYLSLLDSFGYLLLDFFNPVRSHNQLIQADALFVSSLFSQKIKL